MELRKGYKQTEVGMIPKDWVVKELGDIGTFKNGINKNSDEFGYGHPFVNLMDVFGKSSISGNENFGLLNSNETERKLYDLRKGDVLFIRSSVKPSGVGLTCVIENDLPDVVFSGFIIRFRDNDFLTVGYKKHCFYNERFRNNLIGSSSVSANTNINQDALKKLSIPLPPTKAEQTAIATALSDMDNLIAGLEKLIKKKKAIKQGVMQELLRPKEGWVVKKLGEITLIAKSGGTPTSTVKTYYGGSIPFLSISDMTTQGKYLYTTEKTITEIGLQNSSSWIVPENSIIYSMYASVGLVSIAKIPLAISQAVLCIVFDNGYDTEFMYYYLSSIKESIIQFIGEGTQKNLNSKTVKDFNLQIPELDEQLVISRTLIEIDEELLSLENLLAKYKCLKQGMMQELLTGKTRLI